MAVTYGYILPYPPLSLLYRSSRIRPTRVEAHSTRPRRFKRWVGLRWGLGPLLALGKHCRIILSSLFTPHLPHHRSAPSAAPRALRCILMGHGCSMPSWPAAATPLWTLGRCVWGGAIRTCSVGEYDVGRYGVVRYGVGGMAWGGTGTHRGLGSLRLYLCPLAPHPCTISTWKTPPIEPHPF